MLDQQLLRFILIVVAVAIVGPPIGRLFQRSIPARWERPRVWLARLLLLSLFGAALWLFAAS